MFLFQHTDSIIFPYYYTIVRRICFTHCHWLNLILGFIPSTRCGFEFPVFYPEAFHTIVSTVCNRQTHFVLYNWVIRLAMFCTARGSNSAVCETSRLLESGRTLYIFSFILIDFQNLLKINFYRQS